MTRRIPECHPERLHQAKGLCAQCYLKQYDAKRYPRKDPSEYSPNYRKPPHATPRVPDCHPDREHWARGMCGPCYSQHRVNGVKANCHPQRPHLAAGLCARCYAKRKYEHQPEEARLATNQYHREAAAKLRNEMVIAYGAQCACINCPETDQAFLTLDHINKDGKAHRAKVGSHSYADLRRRGWPQDGYRLLCWNCNAMTRFGPCPHEEVS